MLYTYYFTCLLASIILSLLYVYKWHKHFEVNITLIFVLIPIANLGYVIESTSKDVDQFIAGTMITYIGGCFLPLFINLCVLRLCKIHVKRWMRLIVTTISFVTYLFVLTIGRLPYFYKSIEGKMVGNEMVYQKEYGIWHTLLFVVIGCYFVVGLTGIIYAFVKKSEVSRIVLILLILPEALSLFGFWGARLISRKIEILPILYVVAQLVYLLIIRRITFYNINETVIDSMVQTGETGLISFDLGYRYLGSNETAKEIIPGLRNLHVDQNLIECEFLNHNVLHWIKHFKDESESKNLYVIRDPENEENNRAYIVDVNYLYHGSKIKGYDLLLRDDTKNQKYIELLDKYNNELEEEVDRKTKRIVEMHDNLIMSMAMMVEGRDNSTGGHVKRVSDCTRMLIDEIKKDNRFGLSDEFFRDVIKAAPLHDIGKITVEDAILRKEGKYNDEEYDIMKSHAAEGAKILRKILKDTDDESYKKIAENVAHYHHERVDGKGYPDHLKGDEIPIEARIVAVADVYDALACRRVYKGRMSFEEVDSIIMEGMGTQFDKDLEEYYVKAREHFEEYYTSLQENDADFDKVK